MRTCVVPAHLIVGLLSATGLGGDVFHCDADRVVETHNREGGWDGLLSDWCGDFPNVSDRVSRTTMGWTGTHGQTGDPSLSAALPKAGDYLLQNQTQYVTPAVGCLAVAWDKTFALTACTGFVRAHTDSTLWVWKYVYRGNGARFVGTEWDTALGGTERDNQYLPDLAGVDPGMGLSAARQCQRHVHMNMLCVVCHALACDEAVLSPQAALGISYSKNVLVSRMEYETREHGFVEV
jgi:hypothetical protein